MVKRLGGWPYLVAGFGLVVTAAAPVLFLLGTTSGPSAYWTAAVGASVFTGFASLAVWRQAPPADKNGPLWPWHVHKWWFNGAGSFAGWYALYVLHGLLEQKQPLTVSTFLLALVALLGVGGWLPAAVVGFAIALRTLAEKAVDAIGKSKSD